MTRSTSCFRRPTSSAAGFLGCSRVANGRPTVPNGRPLGQTVDLFKADSRWASTSSRHTQGGYLQAVDLLIPAVDLFKVDSRWASTSSRQTQGGYLQAVDLLIPAVDLFKVDSRWVSTSGRSLDSSGRPLQGRLKVGLHKRSTSSRQTQRRVSRPKVGDKVLPTPKPVGMAHLDGLI